MPIVGGASQPAVNISAIIEQEPIGSYRKFVIVLCVLVAFIDGWDIGTMSVAAPTMRLELHLAAAMLGVIFSATPFGSIIGNLICGPISDKIGRRPVIIFTALLFAFATLATAFARNVGELIAIRAIAGVGLGVANITAYALCAEYAPKRLGATSVAVASTGYILGGTIGSFLAAGLVPIYGWRIVFYLGGGIGVALGALVWLGLPESMQFLALHQRQSTLAKLLSKIDPKLRLDSSATFTIEGKKSSRSTVTQLFIDGRGEKTILLWIMYFFNSMELFFITQWLPTLTHVAGFSVSSAISAGVVLQCAAMAGTLTYAYYLKGRPNPFRLVALLFALAAIGFLLLGRATSSLWTLYPCVAMAGLFVPGLQGALNGIIAAHYPTNMRSTGLSWAISVGRIGSVQGPILAGLLLSWHWKVAGVLSLAALPASCGLLAGLRMAHVLRNKQDEHATWTPASPAK